MTHTRFGVTHARHAHARGARLCAHASPASGTSPSSAGHTKAVLPNGFMARLRELNPHQQ